MKNRRPARESRDSNSARSNEPKHGASSPSRPARPPHSGARRAGPLARDHHEVEPAEAHWDDADAELAGVNEAFDALGSEREKVDGNVHADIHADVDTEVDAALEDEVESYVDDAQGADDDGDDDDDDGDGDDDDDWSAAGDDADFESDLDALPDDEAQASPLVRLNKYLASHGVASRRGCDLLIAEGGVMVDDEIVTDLGVKVDPRVQRIEVDGVVLKPDGVRHRYYLLNKPSGVVCTNSDRELRPRAVDLITDREKGRLFSVGRLDEETTGLIILTNDGDFANRVMHPRYGVHKTYQVKVQGLVDDEAVNRIRNGVHLAEGVTSGARVIVLRRAVSHSKLLVTIQEGKNREVRRVFARFGYKVVDLKRIRIGPLTDRGLKAGSWRPLKRGEIEALLAGPSDDAPNLERLKKKAARGGPRTKPVRRSGDFRPDRRGTGEPRRTPAEHRAHLAAQALEERRERSEARVLGKRVRRKPAGGEPARERTAGARGEARIERRVIGGYDEPRRSGRAEPSRSDRRERSEFARIERQASAGGRSGARSAPPGGRRDRDDRGTRDERRSTGRDRGDGRTDGRAEGRQSRGERAGGRTGGRTGARPGERSIERSTRSGTSTGRSTSTRGRADDRAESPRPPARRGGRPETFVSPTGRRVIS